LSSRGRRAETAQSGCGPLRTDGYWRITGGFQDRRRSRSATTNTRVGPRHKALAPTLTRSTPTRASVSPLRIDRRGLNVHLNPAFNGDHRNATLDDVVVLCGACHRALHNAITAKERSDEHHNRGSPAKTQLTNTRSTRSAAACRPRGEWFRRQNGEAKWPCGRSRLHRRRRRDRSGRYRRRPACLVHHAARRSAKTTTPHLTGRSNCNDAMALLLPDRRAIVNSWPRGNLRAGLTRVPASSRSTPPRGVSRASRQQTRRQLLCVDSALGEDPLHALDHSPDERIARARLG
jgi:hypothetical protein